AIANKGKKEQPTGAANANAAGTSASANPSGATSTLSSSKPKGNGLDDQVDEEFAYLTEHFTPEKVFESHLAETGRQVHEGLRDRCVQIEKATHSGFSSTPDEELIVSHLRGL